MKAFRLDLRMGWWRSTTSSVAVCATSIAIACGGGTLTTPSSGALVTFAVGSETFRVALTTTDQVAAARAAQSGGRARIPIGRVVSGTQVNAGLSWHLEDVTFAEVAIELCDDVLRMSSALESSSVGTFLPMERDCGTDRLTWVSHQLPVKDPIL